MVKLYKGLASKDSRFKTMRTGYVRKFEWLTTNREEARAYAAQRAKYDFPGSRPVVLEIEVPDRDLMFMWELGGSGFDMSSRYYKTFKGLYPRVREV
jgi:hypothetical protein